MDPAPGYRIDPGSPTPPYEQLRAEVARRAADGELPVGARLPTVRALAEQAGVAVNTVARAYKELEADGVIETRGRAGSFVAARDDVPAALREAAVAYAQLAGRLGVADDDARRLVDEALAAG
ncbi:GntR family transcriptional regulator [Clavibacter michiganensis]|uniref:GntR family transcriptional regulator n=1 Tax=Clavibacter michiganensis subsp. insidiosus TaxID=33014 RepID=A0A0D5CG04_9MICO|nr:GntR family transcriptional regulator [Clavibacter michiganensis]AJW78209.1 GntR family transcriptional regulator [Clavibacter michiganensis subsp. insidiosus]AWF99385.1 GntR family transcriptional regulator [Clavibacter michiganensis subsp. insidiosus]AWG00497.1 GntR family transcriptional regulator [Clavibacter michiganensis subsp. insidiosus]OQJ60887.1 GntR family transcriptional regulator [Clavibacter michiganensis subsp. insidiosus]RII86723.1 GntR family transcriptional regulator [Clav